LVESTIISTKNLLLRKLVRDLRMNLTPIVQLSALI